MNLNLGVKVVGEMHVMEMEIQRHKLSLRADPFERVHSEEVTVD
jgi:hypothetical protein